MLEMWRWHLFPGERFSSSGHPTGTFELLHVEQGTLTVTVDETVLAVTQGSSAVARTDAPHAYANDSDEEVWFTMTVSERHS